MKKLLFVNIIVALALQSIAQKNVVFEDSALIQKNLRPCISLYFTPSPKELRAELKDYLSKQYNFKTKKVKEGLTAKEALFPEISSNKLDFYCLVNINPEDSLTRLQIVVAYGYDVYLNTNDYPNEYQALKKIATDFYYAYHRKYFNQQLVKDSEELAKLEKSEISTNKKNEKLTKKNDKIGQKILKLQALSEKNNNKIQDNANYLIDLLNNKSILQKKIQQNQDKLETLNNE